MLEKSGVRIRVGVFLMTDGDQPLHWMVSCP